MDAGAGSIGAASSALPHMLHNMLHPAGPQAAHILDLWNLTLLICTVVLAMILVALLLALRGRSGDERTPPDLALARASEPVARRSVIAAALVAALLLIGLIVASILTDRILGQLSLRDALHIEVTARQFWWKAHYDDEQPANTFTVANEIHIPVGRPVIATLKSDDVIHSLWIPSLAGKMDLIPGRTATLKFRADQPGTYRAQCAEFCGFQHSRMVLVVVAETPERYAAWAVHQRESAPEPSNAILARGKQVFLASSCAMCHAIQGTQANAQQAPDLTHVASRSTLAAGTLATTPANLAAWIADPQAFKPGNNMPRTPLAPEDLQALVAYLGSLQ